RFARSASAVKLRSPLEPPSSAALTRCPFTRSQSTRPGGGELRTTRDGRERSFGRMTEHILIAGGGIAAVETVAALRALAGPRPGITVLAPEAALAQRPSGVGVPFGFGAPGPLPLAEVARHAPFSLREGVLVAVEAGSHVAITSSGEQIGYDTLVV